MKLYLSSYKVGDRVEELKKWINQHGNKICLIPNSRDIYPESERKTNGIKADVEELTNIGFDDYLRTIENCPDYLYAGYSAGICVLAKDMHGLDICDDPNINPYGIDTMWNGLGYFDYIFLPHYKSNHKETELIDTSVEYCNHHNIKYKTLRDGEVIIQQIERKLER